MKARALFICLIGLLFILPVNVLAVSHVSWDPGSITQTLMVGESTTFSVSFRSSISLEDPELFIVPELEPFVTASGLKSIRANKRYRVKLTLTAPPETMLGPYVGTIHLRDAKNTLPDTLKINLSILRPMGMEGGILEFRNGVILEIPPGAINEPTAISVTDLNIDQVETIIAARPYASHEKRHLGGFSGKPDDLIFNIPIKARIPILPLDSNEILVLMKVYPDKEKYYIQAAEILLNGAENMVEVEIDHFCSTEVGGVKMGQEAEADLSQLPPCCLEVDADISSPTYLQLVLAGSFPLDCCCVTVKTENTETDFANGIEDDSGDLDFCQIVGSDLDVTWEDCPGQPEMTHYVSELTAGCPEDMTVEIKIDPPGPLNLFMCDDEKLTSYVTLTDADGIPKNVDFPAMWLNEPPEVAEVLPGDTIYDVTFKGLKEGVTVVKAMASRASTIPPPAEVVVNVRSKIHDFKLVPSQVSLTVGEQSILEATGTDYDGNPLNVSDVTWSTDDPLFDIVEVVGIHAAGKEKEIKGIDKGSTIITATYYDGCETKEATADITVEPAGMYVQVSPQYLFLDPGEPWELKAELFDSDGNQHSCSSVDWYSSNLNYVDITSAINNTCIVTAVSEGAANVSANCDGLLGYAEVTVNEGDEHPFEGRYRLSWRLEKDENWSSECEPTEGWSAVILTETARRTVFEAEIIYHLEYIDDGYHATLIDSFTIHEDAHDTTLHGIVRFNNDAVCDPYIGCPCTYPYGYYESNLSGTESVKKDESYDMVRSHWPAEEHRFRYLADGTLMYGVPFEAIRGIGVSESLSIQKYTGGSCYEPWDTIYLDEPYIRDVEPPSWPQTFNYFGLWECFWDGGYEEEPDCVYEVPSVQGGSVISFWFEQSLAFPHDPNVSCGACDGNCPFEVYLHIDIQRIE